MGLSGRRAKQRIGKDPRNLSWADDASRFGQAYLAKFGWDASKGLGASGEGRTSAIKTTQKLDMLGIGMRHQSGVEGGIAWQQNRDFEDLLRRLNDGTTTETTNSAELLDSFHKAREPKSEALEDGTGDRDGEEKVKDDDGNCDGEEERQGVMAKKEKKRKKGKRKASVEEEEVEERENLDRKERKKRRKKSSSKDNDNDDDGRASSPRPSSREALAKESRSAPMDTVPATATRPTVVAAPVPVRAPPRTHRARIIAAKRMAASNSTALAEILGIPPSSSSSARPSAVASPLPDPALTFTTTTTTNTITITSNATATPEAKDLLHKLTTSSQSVGDYFRAKLDAKALGERQVRPTLAAASASTRDDDDDNGRTGLGLGGGPSRILPPDGLDDEPARGGIGSSSSSMIATMFMPRQPTTNAREENTPTVGVETVISQPSIVEQFSNADPKFMERPICLQDHFDIKNEAVTEFLQRVPATSPSDHDDNLKKSEKMRAKEERRRKREERRRKRAEARQVDHEAVDGARAAQRSPVPVVPDGRLQDSHPTGADGRAAIATKKRKKDKKSSKHRGLEE